MKAKKSYRKPVVEDLGNLRSFVQTGGGKSPVVPEGGGGGGGEEPMFDPMAMGM